MAPAPQPPPPSAPGKPRGCRGGRAPAGRRVKIRRTKHLRCPGQRFKHASPSPCPRATGAIAPEARAAGRGANGARQRQLLRDRNPPMPAGTAAPPRLLSPSQGCRAPGQRFGPLPGAAASSPARPGQSSPAAVTQGWGKRGCAGSPRRGETPGFDATAFSRQG